ncbi:MAG: hypothetical protein WA374_10345 [Acidobacteriaceae bacterium]
MRDNERMVGDELDSRIDAALRSYAEPGPTTEPRVALVSVMEQVRRERPASGMRGWLWGMAGTSASLVAVAFALWAFTGPRVPEIAWSPKAPGAVAVPIRPLRSAVATNTVSVFRPTAQARRTSEVREFAANRRTLPKLDVFPTPRPLTPEEQALVAFATDVPPKVQQQVVNAEKHVGDPITIAALKIRPLDVGEPLESKKER